MLKALTYKQPTYRISLKIAFSIDFQFFAEKAENQKL
jgi:hypothetical protein